MLRFMIFVADLFLLLPWWGAVGVLVGLAFGFWALARYIMFRFMRDVTQAIKAQGEPLNNAFVTVHSVKPTEPPTTPSLLDEDDEFDDEDDKYDDSEMDGAFASDDFGYFWIEATIAPQETQTVWDPSALALVPADFQPDTELEFSGQTALLHTLEVWRNGRFQAQGADNVTGTQRLRMLFAIPHGVQQAKFAYHFTHFGRVALPGHLAIAR